MTLNDNIRRPVTAIDRTFLSKEIPAFNDTQPSYFSPHHSFPLNKKEQFPLWSPRLYFGLAARQTTFFSLQPGKKFQLYSFD